MSPIRTNNSNLYGNSISPKRFSVNMDLYKTQDLNYTKIESETHELIKQGHRLVFVKKPSSTYSPMGSKMMQQS
jgi:hypothetical protein